MRRAATRWRWEAAAAVCPAWNTQQQQRSNSMSCSASYPPSQTLLQLLSEINPTSSPAGQCSTLQLHASGFSFMLQLQASGPPACWKVPFPLCVVLEWPLTEHVGVVHLQRGNDGERQAAASVTVCPGLRGHQTLNRALGGMSCVLLLFFSSSTSCCASYLHWMFYLTCIIHSVWMFDLHCA